MKTFGSLQVTVTMTCYQNLSELVSLQDPLKQDWRAKAHRPDLAYYLFL